MSQVVTAGVDVSNYVMGGVGYGPVAQRFMAAGGHPRHWRPYMLDVNNADRQFIAPANPKDKPEVVHVKNADATLTYDQWKHIDRTVRKTSRSRLGAWMDLEKRGLIFDVPGGIGKTVILTQQQSDPGQAQVSIDGVQRGNRDRPEADTTLLPLPIVSADWSFTWREIQEAANSGMPLDTHMVEACTRRVMEVVEQFTVGTYGTYYYGGGNIYGYTNFPSRLTGSLDDPTGGSWTPDKLLNNIFAMRQALYGKKHFGPYVLYIGLGWDQYIDRDYSSAKGDNTIRQRILAIGGDDSNGKIMAIKTLDYLPSMAMVMVEMDMQTVRGVRAMSVMPIRWSTEGGLLINGKVMACLVPQLFKDKASNVGIAHYTV